VPEIQQGRGSCATGAVQNWALRLRLPLPIQPTLSAPAHPGRAHSVAGTVVMFQIRTRRSWYVGVCRYSCGADILVVRSATGFCCLWNESRVKCGSGTRLSTW